MEGQFELAAAKAAKWEDTDEVAEFKTLIEAGDLDAVDTAVKGNPDLVHLRSADGKGPLFWAYATGNKKIRKYLTKNGCQKDVLDADGNPAKFYKK